MLFHYWAFIESGNPHHHWCKIVLCEPKTDSYPEETYLEFRARRTYDESIGFRDNTVKARAMARMEPEHPSNPQDPRWGGGSDLHYDEVRLVLRRGTGGEVLMDKTSGWPVFCVMTQATEAYFAIESGLQRLYWPLADPKHPDHAIWVEMVEHDGRPDHPFPSRYHEI
ncbi:hypothetical protein F4778DRAFT_779016 [Xylariomycetidae sp. FL2044]|nr:hypothetical protein F4778DRAFT_779016 [Xylariomycetidae sp. FL2044]